MLLIKKSCQYTGKIIECNLCSPVMIIALAQISRLCMTDIGRRLGPKRAKESKNRLNMGVLGGKCGSSHESCEA